MQVYELNNVNTRGRAAGLLRSIGQLWNALSANRATRISAQHYLRILEVRSGRHRRLKYSNGAITVSLSGEGRLMKSEIIINQIKHFFMLIKGFKRNPCIVSLQMANIVEKVRECMRRQDRWWDIEIISSATRDSQGFNQGYMRLINGLFWNIGNERP